MKICKLHIHSAKYIKHVLGRPKRHSKTEDRIRLLQIYECRVLGLCFYRTEGSYLRLKAQDLTSTKPTINEIKEYYKFKPTLEVWTGSHKGRSFYSCEYDELYYGGPWIRTGYFVFINLSLFSLHIRLSLWRIKF